MRGDTEFMGFRLNTSESRSLNKISGELGVTPSAYLRGICCIPAHVFGIEDAALNPVRKSSNAIIVYDKASIPQLHMQLRRWGYHLDGALKALNTIAKKEFMRPEDAERICLDAVAAMHQVADARESLEARIDTLGQSWAIQGKGVL